MSHVRTAMMRALLLTAGLLLALALPSAAAAAPRGATLPELTFPASGATVTSETLRFQWDLPATGEVERLVVEQRAADGSWAAWKSLTLAARQDARLVLMPAGRYRWRVDSTVGPSALRGFLVTAHAKLKTAVLFPTTSGNRAVVRTRVSWRGNLVPAQLRVHVRAGGRLQLAATSPRNMAGVVGEQQITVVVVVPRRLQGREAELAFTVISGTRSVELGRRAIDLPDVVRAAEGWPLQFAGYTVVLRSLAKADGYIRADAVALANEARAAGVSPAAVLDSDDFVSLCPGYWMVFHGRFAARQSAVSLLAAARAAGYPQAHVTAVSTVADPACGP